MLDPWIIEEIRRRERERQEREQAPRIELPLNPTPGLERDVVRPPAEQDPRGIVVIDL